MPISTIPTDITRQSMLQEQTAKGRVHIQWLHFFKPVDTRSDYILHHT